MANRAIVAVAGRYLPISWSITPLEFEVLSRTAWNDFRRHNKQKMAKNV
jgi:hypothetical protein